ncbi:hypothetical protein H6G93_17940 [Nostoc sp. FACHB-973]|nr:hypothetical protein [Nostoc sp. FACHB-973]
MSRYCENKSSATVNITWSSGEKKQVISENPYIDVSAVTTASYTLEYYYSPIGIIGAGTNTKSIGSFVYPLTLGNISYSNPSEYGGNKYSDVSYTDGSNNSGTIAVVHNSVYGHTVSNLRLIASSIQTQVTITDSQGKVIVVSAEGTATWEVSCDDDCPADSHKCTHNKYPGYCCVPCQEVGNRLKNIASKVRG